MSASSMLLIECLSGLGAHETDAALRVRALRKAGVSARAIVIDAATPAERSRALADAAARAVAERPAAVWIAGSERDWRFVDRAMPATLPRLWWPAVLPGSGGEPDAGSHPASHSVGAGAPLRHLALHCAPVRAARDRAAVALWDGDFILVPGALRGREGERLLRGYAQAVEERPELDLVVLADPDPAFQALAHSLGIGWRVHCAGESPREAEHTWLATATAVLLPLEGAVAAGLVLRILAAGAPLVVDPKANAASSLLAWLDDTCVTAASPAEAITLVLAREPGVRDACERGRLRAAQHEPDALAARLAAALGGEERRPREAA